MLPSSTVENYIKVIHAQQVRLSDPDGLVPMGHLAMGMGVTPGTATTMVKALADSGLVHYAPYAGVRLTRAGERLAALVIRRHRLIELFLVQVIGLRWDEVHDEAEQLEHVVSDRLIERMDEMLGRPEVDPHGDPIPGRRRHVPAARVALAAHLPSATCRSRSCAWRIRTRAFLRFVESTRPQARTGTRRRRARRSRRQRLACTRREAKPLTIGARAASKLLVDVIGVLIVALGLAATVQRAVADARRRAAGRDGRFEPSVRDPDNSFFVEEAFNQEPGVVQTIYRRRVSAGQRVGSRSRRNGRRPTCATSCRSRFPSPASMARTASATSR